MSTKTIAGTYASGYVLASTYSGVSITGKGLVTNVAGTTGTSYGSGEPRYGGTGGIGGVGLVLPRGGDLVNSGAIAGGRGGQGSDGYVRYSLHGIYRYFYGGEGDGGTGGVGVQFSASGAITNFGTIAGGPGGAVGYAEGPYAVYGRPGTEGTDGVGINLEAGGSVINFGTIEGNVGIVLNGPGTIFNHGAIDAVGAYGTPIKFDASSEVLIAYSGSSFSSPVVGDGGVLRVLGSTDIEVSGFGQVTLAAGASCTFMGANTITNALAFTGVSVTVSGGTLNAYGSIAGTVALYDGSLAVLGGETLNLQGSTIKNISGTTFTDGKFSMLVAGGVLQLPNNIVIRTLDAGVELDGTGGSIGSLSSATSKEVSIEATLNRIGSNGLLAILGGVNWDSESEFFNAGNLDLGGGIFSAPSLVNTGLISGSGVISALVTDSGQIEAIGNLSFTGESNHFAGTLYGGTILMAYGVSMLSTLRLTDSANLSNAATVTQLGVVTLDFGSIVNQLNAGWEINDKVALYAGSTGSFANAGTLSKATGTSTLGVGVDFTNTGTVAIAAGALDFDGAVNSFAGAVSGAGTLVLGGGSDALAAGLKLTIAHVEIEGAATGIVVNQSLAYAGVWTQTAGAVSVAAGKSLRFAGAGDTFGGTLAGAGTVEFSGGSDGLKNVTLSASHMAIAAAAVTLEGGIVLTGVLSATTASLVVGASGATLEGGGTLVLADVATNSLHGASASARLINDDRIQGAGQLGGGEMSLVNGAKGSILGDGAVALTIDTGVAAISNAGLIESVGTGGLAIDGAIDNTGTLTAAKGALTVDGAVTGAGKLVIDGGVADFASAFSQAVTFDAAGGMLKLARSLDYTGTITGFSKTGGASLDLGDIAFGASTKAAYSGTATSGVLTVTDGTHTARIKLAGNYTASTFTVSSDGHGGTTVIDPAGAAAAQSFASAMARFAPTASATGPAAQATGALGHPILAPPG